MDNKQTGVNVYTYLSHVQSLCSQYLHTKTRLIQLDSDLQKRSLDFDALPNYQNLSAVNEAWNQKFSIMGMIPQIIDNIIYQLTEATRFALSSMQASISVNNQLSVSINDNAIASICSLVEQRALPLHLKELYRQSCIRQNIPLQLSDIEIRARMIGVTVPYFNQLKIIIRGY